MQKNTNWDPNFGTGINVHNEATGAFARATAQRAVGTVGNSVVYTDESGRRAQLGGLSREEMQVLVKKHGS